MTNRCSRGDRYLGYTQAPVPMTSTERYCYDVYQKNRHYDTLACFVTEVEEN